MSEDDCTALQNRETVKSHPDGKVSLTLVFAAIGFIQLDRRCVGQNELSAIHREFHIYRQLLQILEYLLANCFLYVLQIVMCYLPSISIPQRLLTFIVVYGHVIMPFCSASILFEEYVQTGKIVWKRVRPDPKISLAPYYHELLRRFCQHEANTRAIGFESLRDEENVCRKFFAYLDASGCHTCQDINLVNVNAFLLFIASQRKSSMDRVCNTLKHLSAYLVSIQNCCDFSAALTTRPAPRKKLRPAFSAKEVHTVVDAAAKNPSLSLRDTAMFAVAASLGLRAGDIVRLTLSDIDWIHHEIRFVQNKTGVELHLPLEASVGNAIANYILHERPKTQSPALFVRSRIPFDFMTSTAAGDRLRKYMKLSDVEYTPGDGKGFHSFRRYVASSMINQEVPIDTVKEILGHTQIGSMKAYMRISRDKLAMCALGLDGIEVVQEALL